MCVIAFHPPVDVHAVLTVDITSLVKCWVLVVVCAGRNGRSSFIAELISLSLTMLTARRCQAAGLRSLNVSDRRTCSLPLSALHNNVRHVLKPPLPPSSLFHIAASRLCSSKARCATPPRRSYHSAFVSTTRPSQPRHALLTTSALPPTAAASLLFSRAHSLFLACRRHASNTTDKQQHDQAHKHTQSTDPTSSQHSNSDTDAALSFFSSNSQSASDEEPPPQHTVPAATVGNLDAEIGEAMAVTGADLSTPAQSTTASSPTSSFTQSEDMLAALELHIDGTHYERQYSRLQLARRFGLHPRDLRFLDSSLRNLPSLLVRREVIIVNLELFKAIISATEVLMFDPWYPHIQSIVPLMKHALQAFHRANEGLEPAVGGGEEKAGRDEGERSDKSSLAASSDVFKSAFDYVSSFDVKPPRMEYSGPSSTSTPATSTASLPPSQQSTESLSSSSSPPASTSSSSASVPSSSSSSSRSATPPPSSSSSSLHPSSAPLASTQTPSPPDADHPHLPPHAGSTPAHPSLRHLAADLESTLRDRTLYGLHESEKEYEEWIEPRMPFEFIALELILMTVTRTLESRFEVYNSSLAPLLSSSSTTLNEGSTLMHLLQLKNGLTSFEVVLGETGWALRHVLQDDADMAEMFLTMKAKGQVPRIEEHGEIEVLLETYLRKVDELENEVRTNVKSISLTEEHIQIRLDTVRNAMMKVDLLLTICTFAVAASALIASTFGMNLSSKLEQSDSAFWIASAVMAALTVLLIRFGLRLCRRHKIDLFHAEPDEPKLRLPMNNMRKHKHRLPSSPMGHSSGNSMAEQRSALGRGMKEAGGRRGGKSWGGEDAGRAGLYDREEWVSQTLEYKLKKLEEMKERQQRQMKERQERIERELREKQEWMQREFHDKQEWMREKEDKLRKWQLKELERHREKS